MAKMTEPGLAQAVLAGLPAHAGVPMVGREKELGLLIAHLDAATAGNGGVALVCGEPGIGKTRLVSEVGSTALARGMAVLRGHCFRAEGALPYRPWIEVLSHLADGSAGVGLGAPSPNVAADLKRLAPELGGLVAADGDATASPGDRLRLMDSVSSVLLAAAAARPVLLLLEDFHWADGSSAEMLAHLSRRAVTARLAIVVTFRETEIGARHPFEPVLAEFSERRSAFRVQIPGLTRDEARMLVSLHTGIPELSITEKFIWGLLSVTDGNPYFIEEVLRHFQETGQSLADMKAGDDPFTHMVVPHDLRHVLAQRVQRLSDDTAGVLQAAAILGRQFEFEPLKEMTGLPEAHLLASLEEAMRAHLVVDVRSAPGRFEFEHALAQRALTESMAGPRRQRMHLGAALALEKLRGKEPGRWAGAIAFHFRTAGDPGHVEHIARFGGLAMDSAAGAYAWDAFSWQFEQTLASLDSLAAPEVVVALFICDAIFPRYNLPILPFETLRSLSRRAGDVLLASGDTLRAARMRQVEGYTYQSSAFRRFQNLGEALRLFDEAATITSDPQFLEAITGSRPNVLFQMGRCHEADEIARQMTTSSRLQTRCWGLSYHGHYAVHLGAISEGLRSFERAIEESGVSVGVLSAAATALQWQAICALTWLRAPALVEPLQRTEIARDRFDSWLSRVAQISALTASRERGAALSASVHDYLGSAGDQADFEITLWLFRDGEWDLAFDTMRRIESELKDPTAAHLHSANAYKMGEFLRSAGRLDEAERRLRGSLLTTEPVVNVAGHSALGLLCAEAGRLQEVAHHAAVCRELMSDDDWFGLGARVELVEALAALATGNRAEAEDLLAAALSNMRRVEHPWDEAEAQYLFGKVLIDLGEPEPGAEHLGEALTVYERIAAPQPFAGRVLAHWPSRVARRPDGLNGSKAADGAAGLSARELEVVRLLVRGLSNRAIAEQLVVSEPTVATHVRHILEKTRTANRAEAAAWAVREGVA